MTESHILAVTTFGGEERYKLVAGRMLNTFRRYWPERVRLVCLVEDASRFQRKQHDVEFVEFDEACPKAEAFRERCSGREQGIGEEKYNFRLDAVSFSHKVFTIDYGMRRAAAEGCEHLIWVDDDVITFAGIEEEFLKTVMPREGEDLTYLSRENYHSETGFLAFAPGSERARQFVHDFVELYLSGEVFHLDEWHDAWVFDWLRPKHEAEFGLRCRSLSPKPTTMHPFINGLLGSKMDHLKGFKRRALGKSFEGDLNWKRPEPYWQKFPSDRWYEWRRALENIWRIKIAPLIGFGQNKVVGGRAGRRLD